MRCIEICQAIYCAVLLFVSAFVQVDNWKTLVDILCCQVQDCLLFVALESQRGAQLEKVQEQGQVSTLGSVVQRGEAVDILGLDQLLVVLDVLQAHTHKVITCDTDFKLCPSLCLPYTHVSLCSVFDVLQAHTHKGTTEVHVTLISNCVSLCLPYTLW